MHFLSFLFTVIANPGIPERKYYYNNYINSINKDDEKNYDRCKRCNIITPKYMKVYHCVYCDVCVINQDHHCTCLGKCIGKNNRFLFYLFIVTMPLYLIMSFITLVAYVIYFDEESRQLRRIGRRKY
jgi:hypothetical protein